MARELKVVFIAGWGRSGTTLLDMLLGQAAGWASGGEVRYLWDRGILEGRPCACGEPVAQCPVWREASATYLEASRGEVEEIVRAREAFHSRDCWRVFAPGGRRRLQARTARLAEHLREILLRFADTTGARVVVDSSKFPSHGYLLELIPEVDLRVVHLVRDPRATGYSWAKRTIYDVVDGKANPLVRHGTAKSAFYWLSWNATIEALWGRSDSYLRLRYEDFAVDPQRAVADVSAHVGETPDLRCFRDRRSATLSPGHLIAGNPARFRPGLTTITPDESWRRRAPRAHRAFTTAATLPLLRRYGYG